MIIAANSSKKLKPIKLGFHKIAWHARNSEKLVQWSWRLQGSVGLHIVAEKEKERWEVLGSLSSFQYLLDSANLFAILLKAQM